MTIKQLRVSSGMTQKMFSEYFGIPKRTIEDWECGRRNPPDYTVSLIEYKLAHENLREYLLLNGDYNVLGDSVCDVCDDYLANLRYCPLAELGTEDSLICSSACLYYSDCDDCTKGRSS